MSEYYDKKAMERSNRYRKEKRDAFSMDFPKGKKQLYRDYAQTKGKSLSALFIQLIEEDMKKNGVSTELPEPSK